MSKLANSENLDEFRWLVSSEASQWLERAATTEDDPKSLLATTIVLRRDLGPSRTHLVIAQAQLRRRARKKFTHAHRMFFTRQLLEQATEEQIAKYKAGRFPLDQSIADLCCGIGGDLIALADRGRTHAVDRDEVAALLAETNCSVLGLGTTSFQVRDAAGFQLDDFAAWHLDPNRRVEGHQMPKLERHDPDLDVMQELLTRNPRGSIKLAPQAAIPDAWRETAELEWIGSGGECRQLVVWFGDLAHHPGHRTATVFGNGTSTPHTARTSEDVVLPVAEQLGAYLFEPEATVLAANLTGLVARTHRLLPISAKAPYLTGDQAIDSPELSCYEVLETLPFSVRRLRGLLRQRMIGRLEIRRQGVRLAPEQVLAELSLSGDEAATLMLMPTGKRVLAILCRRVEKPPCGK